jgi:predicted signal transduction protein with EAL and GGDEF domain
MSLLLSCAYSVTLFSFVDRPFYLANSVPLLLAIVGCITVLSFCDGGNIAPDTRVSPLRRQTPDWADTRPA